jgi:hypothetical protein
MVVKVLPELLLFAITVVALVAMAPLLDAFDAARIGHRNGALPTLFTLIWCGFLFVALFQLGLIWGRLGKAWSNLRAQRKAEKGAAV